MRAGTLRHRIEIEEHAGTRTAHGGVSQDYTGVATVWGEAVPLAGRELEYGKAVDGRVSWRVTLRHGRNRDLGPRHRLVVRGRTLNVVSVLNVDERDRTLVCLCEEAV